MAIIGFFLNYHFIFEKYIKNFTNNRLLRIDQKKYIYLELYAGVIVLKM